MLLHVEDRKNKKKQRASIVENTEMCCIRMQWSGYEITENS
jgi:hypothetical protein